MADTIETTTIERLQTQLRESDQHRTDLAVENSILRQQIAALQVPHNTSNEHLPSQECAQKQHVQEELHQSRAQLQAILDNAAVGIVMGNEQNYFTFVNQQVADTLGYSAEEMYQMQLFDLIHPAEIDMAYSDLQALHQGEVGTYNRERRYRCKDGSYIWTNVSVRAIRNKHNAIDSIVAVLIDITERKQLEERLREWNSELEQRVLEHTMQLRSANEDLRQMNQRLAFYAYIVESVSDAIISTDMDFHIQSWNRAAENIYGWQRDEVIGKTLDETLATTYPEGPEEAGLFFEEHGFWEGEVIQKHKHGQTVLVHLSVTLLKDDKDNPIGFVGINHDRTEQKRVEEAYRVLVEHSIQGLIIFQDEEVVFTNAKMQSIIQGNSIQSLIAKHLNPDDQTIALQRKQDLLTGTTILSSQEYCIKTKSGENQWVEVHTAPIPFAGKTAMQVSFIDISERKQAEEALRESEARYRTLIETSPNAIFLVDRDCVIRFCNPQAVRLFGYETSQELHGRSSKNLFFPDREEQRSNQTFIETKKIRNRECTLQRKDGSYFAAELNTSVIINEAGGTDAIMVIVRDITRQKQLQANLIANERFAASGRLVASVAHEINTPLQALHNFVDLARIASEMDRDTFLVQALYEIERVSHIVNQLLDLYRPAATKPNHVDVHALLNRIMLLLGKRVKEQKIYVDRQQIPNTISVWGETNELTQVFLNIIINALDAMPNGGTLSISCQKQDHATHIAVSDTGEGIDPDRMNYIFQPFVTTREHGIGLGLEISIQIVQQCGGTIEVESTLDEGSTFTIILPNKDSGMTHGKK